MSSNQFVLAFHCVDQMDPSEFDVRIENASKYVRDLHRDQKVDCSAVTGGHVGIVSWTHMNDSVRWPQLASHGGDDAALWLNFPEHDAVADQRDPLELAYEVSSAGADVSAYGAPFACILFRSEKLTVVNDALGLARLYQFNFGRLTVWSTRPGLAHIFAGIVLEKNETAWAGMATLGWNLGGETHIGVGAQLPGGCRITASPEDGVQTQSHYAEWTQSARSNPASWNEASAGIARAMSSATYFEQDPIADLSGGKDSRVLAAAALRSGVTTHLRTLRTDHGEVETAEALVALYAGEVKHEVRELSASSSQRPDFRLFERLGLAHKGNEGALLPATAVSGAPFRGFVPPLVARFNGHGGESLQGGALYGGRWKSILEGKGSAKALDRLNGMVDSPLGTSDVGRGLAMAAVQARVKLGEEMGIVSAHGQLNYFYNSERMPFWASSFSNRATLTPYYSSGLLRHVARTYWGDTEFSGFHKKILTSLIPEWSSVPFYKPLGSARGATAAFWKYEDWVSLRTFVRDRIDAVSNFDPDRMMRLLQAIEEGEESKTHEVALARFLWEATADSVVDDLNERAGLCARELIATRSSHVAVSRTRTVLPGQSLQ